MRTHTHRAPKSASLGVPFPLLLRFLLSLGSTASAQAISDDSIVYTTLPGWSDMRACARCPFQVNFSICGAGDVLNDVVGCQTNACLCRPSTLGEAVEVIDEKVISLCSNYDDQSTATEFLLRYCSEHGYTSVETAAVPTATVETDTSSEETQRTTKTSQSQPTLTSDSSSSQTTPTTSAPITPSPSSATSGTTNASPTETAGSLKDSSDDKLKTTDLVGIIVGILSLLIAVLTLWVSWKTGRPKKLWQGVTNQHRSPSMAQI